MRPRSVVAAAAVLLALKLPACSSTPTAEPAAPLAFEIDAGGLDNHFYRSGPIAAHVVTGTSPRPRLLFAFPAGNTGAAVWFEGHAALAVDGPLAPVERDGGLRGVTARVHVDAREIHVRDAMLGSVRALRAYAPADAVPRGFESRVVVEQGAARITRTLLDGRHVELTLEPEDGASVAVDASGRVAASAAPGAAGLVLRATALTDEEPLSPMPARDELGASAAEALESREVLSFLSYEEKLLAGSWRFLTYFGRDTLITLELLMPALEPATVEAGLGSVLERLGPGGLVAHEEAVGEWAVVENRERGASGDPRAPVYDYGMVDGDFLLAPALARYLATPAGGARGGAFLARRTSRGQSYRDAALENLDHVLALAAPFATAPEASNLIALHPGASAGDWRDTATGLGGGRIPYDVNVALVPAALSAAAQLFSGPHLGADPARAARARALLSAWGAAAPLFRVCVSETDARARVASYAAEVGLDPAPALASIDGPVELSALALDAQGAPIPVLHSDVGFAWLYTDPPAAEVERAARRLFAPFPAGLYTPIGVLIANPAYADDAALRGMFTPRDYHGTVVWSWQQALLAAGIDRQLARSDLGEPAREALAKAQDALWGAIRRTEALGMGTAELWSFAVKKGKIELMPFGQMNGATDESNAAQLWSTATLLLRPSERGP